MYISEVKHIALVMTTQVEANIGILKGISNYQSEDSAWRFFLDDRAKSVAHPSWLFQRHWDGVICRDLDPSLVEACLEKGIPCVDLEDETTHHAGVPKVRPDNFAVGNLAGEHFFDCGFKHFGFCGFANKSWSIERRMGICEAVAEVGLHCSIFETDYSLEIAPGWDPQVQETMSRWIEALPKPVAILACNDLRALQVMEMVHKAGLLIPEEVAVMGVNNETGRVLLAYPALSSIPANLENWGYRAAHALDCMIQGKEVEKEILIEPLPIVVRRSTEVLAIDDPVVAKAMRLIHQAVSETLRVEALCLQVGVSRSVLERRFRKVLRKSPQEMIRSVKIAKTKSLLIETDRPLVEIAEQIGFENPEYLSVMFKRLTGQPPSEFRKKNQRH